MDPKFTDILRVAKFNVYNSLECLLCTRQALVPPHVLTFTLVFQTQCSAPGLLLPTDSATLSFTQYLN